MGNFGLSERTKGYVVFVLQMLLGVLFLFSGFAKVIDPLGGWYKVDDYLEAFKWTALVPLGFVGSQALSIVEFALGACLITGVWQKLTSIGVLLFMAVMTPLTLYIAIFNPVTDCGCFGEALKISNWETFWKNIVFSSMGILLFVWVKYSPRAYSRMRFWTIGVYTVLFLVGVSIYCYRNLPIIDFRPYSIGTDIRKSMEIPEGAPADVYDTHFIYSKDGVQKEFTMENYPKNDSTWVWVETRSELVSKGYEPPIHDFTMEDPEDGDITDDMLDHEGYTFLIISSRTSKADFEYYDKIRSACSFAGKYQIPVYMMTATGLESDEMGEYKKTVGETDYKIVNSDEITLKTIVRSNPGLVLVKNGVIVNKWATKNIPDFEALANENGGDLENVKEMQAGIPNDYLTSFLFFLVFFVSLYIVVYAVEFLLPKYNVIPEGEGGKGYFTSYAPNNININELLIPIALLFILFVMVFTNDNSNPKSEILVTEQVEEPEIPEEAEIETEDEEEVVEVKSVEDEEEVVEVKSVEDEEEIVEVESVDE